MIGNRIRELRIARNMTLEELGNATNLGKNNIEAYELGKNQPPDDAKIILARYFNVSIDYLLEETDCPNRYDPPSECIRLDDGFPRSAKIIVESLVRCLSYYTNKAPRQAEKELNAAIKELLDEVESAENTPPEETGGV